MSLKTLSSRLASTNNLNNKTSLTSITTSGLVQYFDAQLNVPTTSSWTDRMGLSNLSFTNSPTISNTGGSGNYVTLNGTSQSGSGLTGMLNLSAFTIYMWVKTTSTASNATYWKRPTFVGLATSGDGSRDYGLTMNSGNIGGWSGLHTTDQSNNSSVAINDGNWFEIAMTSSAANGTKIWSNQSTVGSAMTASKSTDATNAPLLGNIGAGGGDGSTAYAAFSCAVLMIYNKELTLNELSRNWVNFKTRYGR